jgi:hypothetical protein
MQWEKKGLVYNPKNKSAWQNNSTLQPTPIILNDKIRVYVGFRDIKGISRIGYIDLNINKPLEIIKISDNPVLDTGEDGMFDENGVTPTCIIKRDEAIYLYYAGYSLGQKVRFQVFTGLAVSKDNGETFQRLKRVPVTDRVDNEELFRVIHSILYDNNVWKTWYGAGNVFIKGANKTLPVYDIRYMESIDGINFPSKGTLSVPIPGGCHRVGRPYVFKENNIFKLYYGYGSEDIPYRLTYAESIDGIAWKSKDINLLLSNEGWDSQMMAYPAYIRVNGKGLLFYNGNNYGYNGFGLAQLVLE